MSRHSIEQQQSTLLMLLGIQAVTVGLEDPDNKKSSVTPLYDSQKIVEKEAKNRPKRDFKSSPKPGKSKHNHR